MIADHHLNPAAVELDAFYPEPPTTVWHALTDPDLLERWLLRPTTSIGATGALTPGSGHA
ncbi:SRPBCC domain-containing protein [Nocardia sp. NPDC020380]|uniref:SRPBCC domain-containing protein n=1 Tax=Nocardia sp. NPDC020380 TaxID=3364309 RepID=UPI003794F4B4